jgi:uncharacterized protein (TIGR04255 family)
MGPSRNPKFDRAPIIEIGISILFDRPQFLTTAHLGRFWERVASSLPVAEDHSPSGLPTEWGTSKEGFPLPRLWLMEAGGAVLIQLQVNRFDLNWRRLSDKDAYPTFDVQLVKLVDYWHRFADFLGELLDFPIVLRGAEVSKVSHIREGEGWRDWRDVADLFPAFALTQVRDRWEFQAVTTVMDMHHEAGRVRAELKLGAIATEPPRRIITLEMRSEASNVQATTEDIGNLVERLTVANEIANLAFTSLASEKAQTQLWGRTS